KNINTLECFQPKCNFKCEIDKKILQNNFSSSLNNKLILKEYVNILIEHYSRDHIIQYQKFKDHVIIRNANHYLYDRLYFDNRNNLRLAYNGIKKSGRRPAPLSNDERKNRNVIAQRRHQDKIQKYLNALEEECESNRNLEENVKKMKLENEHMKKELENYLKQIEDLKRNNEILNYQDANNEFVEYNKEMMKEIEKLKNQINKRDEELDRIKIENEELRKRIDENVTNNEMLIENIGLTSIDENVMNNEIVIENIGLMNEMINEDWKIFPCDFKPVLYEENIEENKDLLNTSLNISNLYNLDNQINFEEFTNTMRMMNIINNDLFQL
ncbi:17320_t:CDS:2, partial [Dentiscutata heterogama]